MGAKRRAIGVGLALAALPTAPAAGAQLTLPSTGLPGLSATHASTATARADLAAGLSHGDSSRVARAQLQVSAAAAKGVAVRSAALRSSASSPATSRWHSWRAR